MSTSNESESESDLLCAPPKKSKGVSVVGNCNESVVLSTQRSGISKSRLSLSQRKRQCPTPTKSENGNNFSESDEDDVIPASQKHLKPFNTKSDNTNNSLKKLKLDFCLEESQEIETQPLPKSPQIYQEILLSPNTGGDESCPSTVQPVKRASFLIDDIPDSMPSKTAGKSSENESLQMREKLDENSNETAGTNVLSLDLTPKRNKTHVSLDASISSEEKALRLLQTTFSASSNSKEDFVRHWVDSCKVEIEVEPMDTQDFIIDVPSINEGQVSARSVASSLETQPLPIDYLVLEMPSDDPHQTPKKTPPRQTVEEELVPSTSGVVSTCTASQTMITPPKQSTQSGRSSTGGSKQTTLTNFFTPCGKSPAKTLPRSNVNQVQVRTLISELAHSEDDESSYIETVSAQMSVKSNPAEAKAQWSQLMSKMRGSANNLRKEMKQSEKRRSLVAEQKQEATEPETNQRRCPFYKRIPGTNFAIDAFNYGRIPGVTCYFLSHFHYDHYQGLGKWLDKPLYCSKVTANLIQLKIKLPSHLIRVIPLNESRVIENVEVILVDANHCPGAVMFLFRFPTGRCVLHVGDFRAHPSMSDVKELTRMPISELYLDTTYCDPNYDFPAQVEVIAYVRRLVRKHIERHPKLLVVSGTYTIGKEKVFMAAAEELDCKIWAPSAKRTVLNAIEDPDLTKRIVSNPTDERVRVHVVNMGDINPRNLKNYLETLNGRFTHILALNPTGWEYDGRTAIKGLDGIQPKVYQGSIFIYGVPYSEHSGYTEMKHFVQRFKPGKIIPTVNVGSAQKRSKMEATFNEWLRKRNRP